MDQGQQIVGFVCQNQDLVATILGVVGVGNVVSWAKGYIPNWLLHVANIAGLNWDDVAKAIAKTLKQRTA